MIRVYPVLPLRQKKKYALFKYYTRSKNTILIMAYPVCSLEVEKNCFQMDEIVNRVYPVHA